MEHENITDIATYMLSDSPKTDDGLFADYGVVSGTIAGLEHTHATTNASIAPSGSCTAEAPASPEVPPHLPVNAHGKDGYNFDGAAIMASKKYKTVDEFATELPDVIRRGAAASGLGTKNYDKEIAYIIDVARKCASITPQRATAIPLFYGMENIAKLGEQYKECSLAQPENITQKVRTNDSEQERGLLMRIAPRGYPVGKWADGKGFIVTVQFAPLKSDHLDTSSSQSLAEAMQLISDAYLFISASVAGSGTNGAANGSVPVVPNRNGGQQPQGGGGFAEANPPDSGRLVSSLPAVIPPPTQSKFDERTLRLTRTNRSESRTATITAPGPGLQNVNVFHIDTRDFAEGGTLVIDINISPGSATAGSFDLFPNDVPIPVQGRPAGTLTGAYDRPQGSSTRLEYRFGRGQVFALNLEGNWASPKGARGLVQFQATVRE